VLGAADNGVLWVTLNRVFGDYKKEWVRGSNSRDICIPVGGPLSGGYSRGIVHLIEPNIFELLINKFLESAVLNDNLSASSAHIHILLVDHSEFRKTKFVPELNVTVFGTGYVGLVTGVCLA